MANIISTITRRKIADELTGRKLYYSGRLKEADFLSRLFDLSKLPSNDYRPQFNTAYKDILQHVDNNNDWQPDWVFTDERFNLMHCDDSIYLNFLRETLSPHVRPNNGDTDQLVDVYNRYLSTHGYQFYQIDVSSGIPVFDYGKDSGQAGLAAKAVEIKAHLDTDYVRRKVEQMNAAVITDTDLALGTGKELLETICKSILKQKANPADKDWSLPQLMKQTTKALDFQPKDAADGEAAERSIKQILGGIGSIVQGVTELRNAYGTGHGKDADFKGLESKYAKLFVGVVAEIAIIYLATNGETEIASETDDLPF